MPTTEGRPCRRGGTTPADEPFAPPVAAVVDALPFPVGVVDADLRWVAANPPLAALEGAEPASLLGRQADEGDGPVARQVGPALRQAVTAGALSASVPVAPAAGGTWTAACHPLPGGAPAPGAVVVLHDAGAEAAARRDAAWAAARLALALDAAAMGSFEYDVQAGTVRWDERTVDLFGLPADVAEATVDTFFEVVHPDDRAGVRGAIDRAVAERGSYDAEFRTVRSGGETRWIEARGRVFVDPDGAAALITGVNIDTTEVRSAREQVARTLEHVSDAFFAIDRSWRFSYLNGEAERVLQRPRQELLGAVVWEAFPEAVGSVFEVEYRRAVVEQRAVEFESFYPPLDTWFWVRAFPAPDGLLVYFTDVSERRAVEAERDALLAAERAARTEAEAVRARLAFLAEASSLVAGTLDPSEVLSRLARLAVPALADGCIVFLPDGDVLRPSTIALGEAVPPLPPELKERGVPLVEGAALPVVKVFSRGAPELIQGRGGPGVGDVGALAAPRDELLRRFDVASVMHVPLAVRGRILGVMTFGATSRRPRFTAEDLALAEELARRAAVAYDNALLYEEQSSLALSLQRSVLPARLPDVPGLRMSAELEPAAAGAEVGGDWYDAFVLPNGRLALCVGDVAGHGVAAASLMGQLRNAVRAYGFDGDGPADVVTRLDRLVEHLHPDALATAVYLECEPATGTVRWASAGHPPLLAVRGGQAVVLESPSGVVLGVGAGLRYEEASTWLPPGAALVAYTDGLIERRGVNLAHSLARLAEAAASAPSARPGPLCRHLLSAMLGDRPVDDDVCALAVQRVEAPGTAPAPPAQPLGG